MKTIPLDTRHIYLCSEDGRIFRQIKDKTIELKGWLHQCWIAGKGYGDKHYRRVALIMKSGKRKDFYVQRLVGYTYHDLAKKEEKKGQLVMRHLSTDTTNNHKDAVLPGTHEENQTIDHIDQGTYMNRGTTYQLTKAEEDALPF